MNNTIVLDNKRKLFLLWMGQLFLTSSIMYLNLIGYSYLLDGNYIVKKFYIMISGIALFIVYLYASSFILSHEDAGWE